jgi:hypothetical protein
MNHQRLIGFGSYFEDNGSMISESNLSTGKRSKQFPVGQWQIYPPPRRNM